MNTKRAAEWLLLNWFTNLILRRELKSEKRVFSYIYTYISSLYLFKPSVCYDVSVTYILNFWFLYAFVYFWNQGPWVYNFK